MHIIHCQKIKKVFPEAPPLTVLNNLDLLVQAGEQIAIMGPSGSGKTTLLQLLGTLDVPTTGSIKILGHDITTLSEVKKCWLRNTQLSFVYQLHHLLPEFTAQENVALPLLMGGTAKKECLLRSHAALEQVGLKDKVNKRPATLSGGERQRVALARALVTQPKCLLADEPTGSLDRENAELILRLIQQLNREHGTSVIMVTHDYAIAKKLDTIYTLENGQLHPEPARL